MLPATDAGTSLPSALDELLLERLAVPPTPTRSGTALFHALSDPDVKGGGAVTRHADKNTSCLELDFTIAERPHRKGHVRPPV